jgi:hypothetical protein
MNLTRLNLLPLVLAAAGLNAAASGARVGEFYPVAPAAPSAAMAEDVLAPSSSRFALRAEPISYDSVARDSIDDTGLRSSVLKADRGSLLMDWYFAGRMRLTSGLNLASSWFDLRTSARSGGFIVRDDVAVPTPIERIEASSAWPGTAAYLGLGYGASGGSGGAVRFDLNGSMGRLGVAGAQPGPQLGGVSQADLDRELALLRENVSRVRLVPQVSLGMNLKF